MSKLTTPICTLLLTCSALAHAAPINMNIVSGNSWLSTTAPGPGTGWTTAGYNDNSWINAYSSYPNPATPTQLMEGPTSAELMWHWDSPGTPTGSNGPVEAYFRYNFTLNLDPSSLPLIGQALIQTDDYFDFYVNGTLVSNGLLTDNWPAGDPLPNPFLVDFTSHLVNGDNVLAIYARDGDATSAFNRGNEFVLFDGTIQTVPEPSTFVLLGFGLAFLGFHRRNKNLWS